MKKNNLKRFLASLLAVLMLSQVTGVAPGVFADNETGTTEPTESTETTVAPVLKENAGEVQIKSSNTDAEIKEILANAFIENTSEVDVQSIEWTYTCAVKGTYRTTKYDPVEHPTDKTRAATVSALTGLTEHEEYYLTSRLHYDATYVYPALAANADGVYELYANGKSVGTINKVAKLKSAINVNNEVATIAIPYTSGTEYDVNALNESIFNAYVTSTTPAGLTYDKLSYTGTVAEGQQTITISYAGDEDHYGTNAPVTVNFVDNRVDTFSLKDRPENLSIGYKGALPNEAESLANVRKQLVNQLADIDLNAVKVEYDAGLFSENYKELDLAAILAHVVISADIKLTYAGDATHKPFTAIVNDIKFADNRAESSIAIKDGASITFNMSADNMKQQIFDNVIDWDSENTKLPAKDTLSIADFKFEIGLKDIADKDGYPNLDAGNGQTIKISFVGNSEFKPCNDVKATIDVAKANVKVTMKKFATAYAGDEEALSKEALNVALDPNDPRIDIYMVFAGVNTNFDGSINLVLTDEQWAFIKKFSALEREIYNFVSKTNPEYKNKPTLEDKLTDGITIGEFKQYVNDAVNALKVVAKIPGVDDILKKYNIDIDSIAAMVSIFTELDFADDTTIAFGVPKHAGMYRAYAIAVNKNYNTNYASGTVLILMNWKNIKIVPNADLKKQTITVSEAKEYADGTKAAATLLNKSTGESSGIDQSALHYRFTGLNKIYSSHDFPTAPGKYIVTVSVRGGDYYALPTTFTFTVKAD